MMNPKIPIELATLSEDYKKLPKFRIFHYHGDTDIPALAKIGFSINTSFVDNVNQFYVLSENPELLDGEMWIVYNVQDGCQPILIETYKTKMELLEKYYIF
jgi:hypothetical protein